MIEYRYFEKRGENMQLLSMNQKVWDVYNKTVDAQDDPTYLMLGLQTVGFVSRITDYTTAEMKKWIASITAESMAAAISCTVEGLNDLYIPRRTNSNLDMDCEEHDHVSHALSFRECAESQLFVINLWQKLVPDSEKSKPCFQAALDNLVLRCVDTDRKLCSSGWTQDPLNFLGAMADLYDDRRPRPSYFWSVA